MFLMQDRELQWKEGHVHFRHLHFFFVKSTKTGGKLAMWQDQFPYLLNIQH
jgi:hypothetical protein